MKVFALLIFLAGMSSASAQLLISHSAAAKAVPNCGSGDSLGNYTGPKLEKRGIYANTSSELFYFNRQTKQLRAIAKFSLDGNAKQDVTDIAIAPDGSAYAIDYQMLYSLDPMNGRLTPICWFLHMNSLEFLAGGRAILGMNEANLLDLGSNQLVKTIPSTVLDGDLAYFGGGFAYAVSSGSLLKFDLAKQTMAVDGPIGLSDVYGLISEGETLVGFTGDGKIVEINPNTLSTNILASFNNEFWGGAIYK